ncbi:hypothetical protein [Mesorhizobium sp. LjNodule214]|uniref:hypothetical protein n=1 Tax=Mesorhizobium sp. LjNodule214 TaxID=3342252 RepID=UPI003ECCD87F
MADQFFRETRRLVFGPLVLLVAATAVFSYFLGDAPNLLFLKLTAVPLYLLAGRAISMLCPLPNGNQLNLVFWERQFLDALLLSCWLTIAIWQPDNSAVTVARGFFLFIALYLGLMFLLRVIFRARKSQHG